MPDLDRLEAIARAVHGEIAWFHEYDLLDWTDKDAAHFVATFDPPTVLALLARVRELEARI